MVLVTGQKNNENSVMTVADLLVVSNEGMEREGEIADVAGI